MISKPDDLITAGVLTRTVGLGRYENKKRSVRLRQVCSSDGAGWQLKASFFLHAINASKNWGMSIKVIHHDSVGRLMRESKTWELSPLS